MSKDSEPTKEATVSKEGAMKKGTVSNDSKPAEEKAMSNDSKPTKKASVQEKGRPMKKDIVSNDSKPAEESAMSNDSKPTKGTPSPTTANQLKECRVQRHQTD